MIVLATVIATAQQGAAGGQWRWHSGDLGSTKYAPLDQINKANVARLQIAWRRSGVDISIVKRKPDISFSRDFRATPLMIDGSLYGHDPEYIALSLP
jgi:glucose dehydrogenase